MVHAGGKSGYGTYDLKIGTELWCTETGANDAWVAFKR